MHYFHNVFVLNSLYVRKGFFERLQKDSRHPSTWSTSFRFERFTRRGVAKIRSMSNRNCEC